MGPRRGRPALARAGRARRARHGGSLMCGIIGYVGRREAASILVEGLHRLEYRGYDSAGAAGPKSAGGAVRKLAGRVGAVHALLGREPLHGTSGIAPTPSGTPAA